MQKLPGADINHLKIIVNATPLLNISTGIGRYFRSLYSEISLQYPELDIKYFNGIGIDNKMPNSPEGKSAWSVAASIAWKLPSIFPYLARVVMHEKRAKRFLRLSKGFDIYHEGGYFPFKAAKNVKTIFTIHDISLKTLPGFHPKERVRFFNKYFENSLQNIDSIITPSEFSKKEIIREYPRINNRINKRMNTGIHPVHLGFDKHIFFRQPEKTVDSLKIKLKLPEKYILFVGTSDPRKNIQSIIKAMAVLPESIKLVCAGWAGWSSIKGIQPAGTNMKDRIFFAGYLTDTELAVLYSGARAFVYPSFYEGFGLPVLEAMACGCPVICSNTSSLPEVAGNAAMTCNPNDIHCLADSIEKVFASDGLYEEMSLKSLEQAKKFSWANAAEKTIKIFIDTLQC
ncbi:MAG: glycosyltransferase family 1 protein [Desulfobacteraceae bacterium]|jgi:glycosyltransferase involved in cell wall biosynthesis|nr:glycosyltransferase family 1 protein [Desulfobacteraceae bacterium]